MMFQKAISKNKMEISALRIRVYKNMLENGLEQWDDDYPTDSILFEDIDHGNMYIAVIDDVIAAYVTADEDIPEEYLGVDFQYDKPRVCIHRLSVNPDFLRMGIASELMHYIHSQMKQIGYKSIVLDTMDVNMGAVGLYRSWAILNVVM